MRHILCGLFVLFVARAVVAGSLEKHAGIAAQATVTAENGIYKISVNDGSAGCGAWTAVTGSLHPAGAGKTVMYGLGTSNTILRSYGTNKYYIAGGGGGCPNCISMCASGPPASTAIGNGRRLTWNLTDTNGTAIEFIQDVVVVGPTNGTETIDNTVIRETHTVHNKSSNLFSFGLRKHWDWQIDGDDGPYFGTCATPQVACDRSMNLTANGTESGVYPSVYVINSNPVATGCPNNVQPVATGCTGTPPYLVAGTVAPPSSLYPPPDAPELLQFGSWNALITSEWLPQLADAALCGTHGSPGDDTSVAYFYGLTQQTAITLGPNADRSFTQYVAAARDSCPAIVADPPSDPCCPPWNKSKLEDMLFYSGSGGIAEPYTLKFKPTPALNAQIQAYVDYVHLVNPAVPAITIHFRVNDAGNGATPTGGPQVGLDHWVTWNAGGGGVPQPPPNFFNLGNELLQINRWYRIHTGIYFENGQAFFPASCSNNDVDVRIQVQPHSLRPVLQVRKEGRTVEKALRPAAE